MVLAGSILTLAAQSAFQARDETGIAVMNVAGGYWLLRIDPDAIDQKVT